MSLNIPTAPSDYDKANEASFRDLVRRAINACFTRGQDVEIGAGRLILKDVSTGDRYSITMVGGTITATLV